MTEAQLTIDLLKLSVAIGVVLVSITSVMIRSYKGGRLGNVLDNQQNGSNQVNGKLDDIHDLTEETKQATEENGEQIQHLGEAIVILHENDPSVKPEELKEKVGVEDMSHNIVDREYPRRNGD